MLLGVRLALPPALVAVAVMAGIAGCGTESNPDGAALTAVATTTQVADLVSNVGGRRVAVDRMLEPNSDPHGYEPRPSDAAAVAEADVVFRSGGEVDDWLGDVIENAGGDADSVDLGEEIGADGDDPHWWQDPRNAIRAVGRIERALSDADPTGAHRYRANARVYISKLRRLDRDVAACIERIPSSQRKLVTTHDALGYYADRYGIEVLGALIPSLSSAAQPSAGDVERLVDQIERLGVQAIFPESSLNPKLERAVARETGASVGRALWADTLGPHGSSGDTYVRSIRSNTAALVDGLTGGRQHCTPGTRRAASRRARRS